MALRRLTGDEVYRIGLTSKRNFADWTNPKSAELNSNPTNDPGGLIWDLTCAINTDGSTFDLEDPDFDDSLTFCQVAGNQERMSENATIVFDIVRAAERWTDAESLLAVDGFNTSNLAMSLIAWRNPEYLAFMSIGESPDTPFAPGQRISMVSVAADWGIDSVDTGSKVNMVQNWAFRGDILWNYKITA